MPYYDPFTGAQLPQVWHDAEVLRQGGRDHPVPAGFFTDWQSDQVRECVYRCRTEIRPQPTIRAIAAALGMQYWIRASRANDCWNSRVVEGDSRGGAALRPDDHRRYTRTRRIVEGDVTRTITERLFGIELEFMGYDADRGNIIRGMRAAGFTARARSGNDDRWGTYYGYDMHLGGWQGTYDSTVTGGEFISPPLPVSDDGLRQVNTAAALIRANGGSAAAGQGTHVHVGCGDLDADGRVRLVENIRTADRFLVGYCPRTRHGGSWCASFTSYRWDQEIDQVRRTGHGSGSHSGSAYNFGHLNGRGTVEFRQMGHTVNGRKLRTWIRVVAALVEATAAGHTVPAGLTTETFAAWLVTHGGLTRTAAARFTQRATGGRSAAA